MNEPLRYLSTFTGIGGFELGIQDAFRKAQSGGQGDPAGVNGPGPGLQPAPGEGTRATVGRPGTGTADEPHDGSLCVGYSEINQPAIKTYEEHFNHENYGDITTIDPDDLPEFGLLVGGFPCQTFSVAGKRAGFADTRGTLFFDVARICQNKRPRHLVLENVKGLLSHDGGKTVETILGVLSDLGYDTEWQLLNSKDFGVPQNRERIYIIGHLRGQCGSKILPLTPTAGAPLHIYGIADGINGNEQIKRVYATDGAGPTIPTGTGGGHMPKIVTPHIRFGNGQRSVRHTLEDTVPTIRATQHKSGDNQAKVLEPPSRVRRLTPVECERLQGFPDGWTLGSDSQRYKQCGNAVTVNVVSAVISRMLERCQL